MKNFNNTIEVGSLNIKSNHWRYQFTSLYIDLEKEFKSEEISNDDIVKDIKEVDYLQLLSYELENEKEISLFLDPQKFERIFGNDIHEIYIFPIEFIITIHIHDMRINDDNNNLSTYYVVNLIADRLIKSGNNYGLNLIWKNGDENFIFEKSNLGFCSYQLFHKEDIK